MSDVLVKIDEKHLALIAALGVAFVVFRPEKAHAVISKSKSTWQPPSSADPYLHLINKATRDYDLPPKLLARLLQQESSFLPEVIDGRRVSSAGAVGIAQIVPKWHPNVNPRIPSEAIDYAAKYLKTLYNRFGTWGDALAAYNWGQGNLSRYKKGELKTMPRETVNYVNQISKDVLV